MSVASEGIALITGGTGTLGQALATRLLGTSLKTIRILSRDEAKQHAMRLRYGDPRLEFCLGDVRDPLRIADFMAGVDVVFHAAGLKQVPSTEAHPIEAVHTNVIGTQNVLRAARANAVSRVVCVSTDKAVAPINAMGMTKALMEKLVVASVELDRGGRTAACVVRYGNVMWSRGSVIPLFVEQIKARRPVTVTDPDMTRFLMPVSEALDLIMFAATSADPGDILVKKSEACRIGQLARVLCELFEAPARIDVVGPRPGEKRHECLLSAEEAERVEDVGAFFRLPGPGRDAVGTCRARGAGRMSAAYSSDHAPALTDAELRERLLGLELVRSEVKSFRSGEGFRRRDGRDEMAGRASPADATETSS